MNPQITKPSIPIDAESKNHYQKAWELLGEYRQRFFLTFINHYGDKEFYGIEVFSSGISMQRNIEHIKSLLAGMGYIIKGDTNSETITIQ